ncbi:MAG: hypothetical protein RLZZ283_310 [Candidatus Parcubacteria bacterium]|jgi:hypothetical protein
MKEVEAKIRQLRERQVLQQKVDDEFSVEQRAAHQLRSAMGDVKDQVVVIERDPLAYGRWEKAGKPFEASRGISLYGHQVSRKPGCP